MTGNFKFGAKNMDSSPHILVVDDHRDIRDLLGKYLQKNGYRASLAESAASARRIIRDSAIDLVVLDIMMPGEDGLSLCRHLRESGNTPIIFLTARAEETDRIVGLEMGADDYLIKPFNPRELLARIKAVLRRAESLPQRGLPIAGNRLAFENWIFDPERRELVTEDGLLVPLSGAEFNILSAFLAHPGRTLSREHLLDITQGRATKAFDRSIDNHISRLRRKIERDPKDPKIIKTVWGGGYVFTSKIERL
jgi:two-component system OmpR family response regulator